MKFALLLMLAAVASAKLAPLLRAKERIEGDYIIKLKDSVDISLLADNPTFKALGGRTQHRYNNVLHGFSATLTETALNFIRNSGLVEYVEEDGIARKAYSWGVDRVNQHVSTLDDNCDYTIGAIGDQANVFVIDSGVSPNDAEFEGRVVEHADFVSRGKNQNGIDCDGHGTHCSGTIAALNYGVARQAFIHGVRVLNCQGSGSWSDVIAGCNYVAGHSSTLKVASLSIGGGKSESVNDAIQGMIDANVAVAVAAGNENSDACNTSPASAPNALTVGATDNTDTRASFSNYGTCVDVFAPGVSITSTVLNGQVATWSGTSMATPHVAAVMALARTDYPSYDAMEIMGLVTTHADYNIVSDPQGSYNRFLWCP